MASKVFKASMSTKTAPIAIIGAGPCGLTLARLLERQKVDYVVYERDESAASANAGGSLDIHEATGQAALRKAGLWNAFRKEARWEDDRFTVYDKFGKPHLDVKSNGGVDEAGRPEIDRKTLRQILLGSVPQEKIRWGSTLKAVKMHQAGSPSLEFTSGAIAEGFKLVVGTDGAWSKVRSMITQAKPEYSGRTYVEAQITEENPLFKSVLDKFGHGTASLLAGASQMIVQRQGNGYYRVYFGIQAPEHYVGRELDPASVDALRNSLLSDFYSDWAEEPKDYIRHADHFRSWPLYHLPVESQNWSTVPGLALAGDAAHLALPNGEGVNCAMLDAMELAKSIENHGLDKLEDAVREYEKDLLVRGKAHIENGIQLGNLMSHESGPAALVKAFQENDF